MKNMRLKIKTYAIAALVLSFSLAASSCKEENDIFADNDNPITITSIHLQDVNDTKKDREVEFARLGQLIRLEGSGFVGVKEILINGENAYINPVLLTDNSLIVRVPREAPTANAKGDFKNRIILKKKNISYTYNFEIRDAAPSISRISHTMPQAGEEITIYGKGLIGIDKITFPGNVVVTDGIVVDEKGEMCTVTVPAGVSNEGGSLLLTGVNGGVYSPAYFNFKKGIVTNFDDVDLYQWNRGEVSDNLTAQLPATGNKPKSQGKYRSLNKEGKTMPASENLVYLSQCWLRSSPEWGDILTENVIAPNTSTSDVAVQMDIYFEGKWNSGNIRFALGNGYSASAYSLIYAPWEAFGKRVEVENPGCWFTITLPLNKTKDLEETNFQFALDVIAAAEYKQAGPWLENGDINGAKSESTNLNVYIDNIRFVPLATLTYSDFADEEETE